jgi:hypothetical protein
MPYGKSRIFRLDTMLFNEKIIKRKDHQRTRKADERFERRLIVRAREQASCDSSRADSSRFCARMIAALCLANQPRATSLDRRATDSLRRQWNGPVESFDAAAKSPDFRNSRCIFLRQ